MPDDLVTVAAFATPVEAGLAKNRLESEGIPVFLNEEATAGWFAFFGPALGGVKIQVAPEHLEKAQEILEKEIQPALSPLVEPSTGTGPPDPGFWICSECGAQIALATDYCPSCGTALAESKDQAQFLGLATEEVEEEPTSGDKLAHKALLCAVVGLAACPPLLHFYSFWLLLQLSFSPWEDVSRAGMAKGVLALAIDTVVIGTGFYFLGVLYL